MNATNSLQVSVVIPTFNTPLPLLIRSVESALGQNLPPAEIIVVDDGSSDDHAAKVADYCSRTASVRLRRQPNLGVAIARNTGILMAQGAYVCFLDADDTLRREFISTASEIALRTRADAVFGGITVHRGGASEPWRSLEERSLSSQREIEQARVGALTFSTTASGRPGPTSLVNAVGALFRTAIAREVQFRPEVAHAEDRLFVSDFLSVSATVALSPEVWYDYRILPSSATQAVDFASAGKLPPTVRALASVAFDCGLRKNEAASSIAAVAAIGAFAYTKLFLQLVSMPGHREKGGQALAELLGDREVSGALSLAQPSGLADRVLCHLASQGNSRALMTLGATHQWLRRILDSGRLSREQTAPEPAGHERPPRSENLARPSVGLIVHYSNTNYGNHLVNFASVRIFERCGFTATLIDFASMRQPLLSTVKRMPRKLLRLGVSGVWSRLRGRLIRQLDALRNSEPTHPDDSARAQRFSAFAEQHFDLLRVQPKDRESLAQAFDRFAVGGDQIWNFDHSARTWHFADFAEGHIVATLAPSVGHSSIPLEWKGYYRQQLSRFGEFGARETDWLDSLGPRDELPRAQLLIDPTLMLDVADWRELAAHSELKNTGLLVYTLGPLLEDQVRFVHEVSQLGGLHVTHLSPKVGGEIWGTDASDFLALLDQCTALITDSFHGAALSFLFDKPVTILPRPGSEHGSSFRVDTLVRQLHLQDRVFPNISLEQVLKHDYSSGKQEVTQLRAHFWDYLERCGFSQDTRPETGCAP